MIVENKFLYTKLIETDRTVRLELTVAGAMLAVLGCVAIAVVLMLIVFPVLTHFGITF